MPDLDGRDVFHEHRHAVLHREHDLADVLERHDATEAADVEELSALGDESAAAVAVVRAERGRHIADRETGAGELGRIDEHLVLHRLAAERRDVGDAGHRAERLVEHPVLQHVQLLRRAIGALQHVSIDESRRRERRLDFGAHTVGQARAGQSLEHLLPREIEVGAFGERDANVREAVERHRARDDEIRKSVELRLDRNGDQPFDFFGGVARPLRRHLDADRRHVGIRVDRQSLQREDAGARSGRA